MLTALNHNCGYKKNVKNVSSSKTIKPVVGKGSIDLLNPSNFRLYHLDLFNFEDGSMRFNGW